MKALKCKDATCVWWTGNDGGDEDSASDYNIPTVAEAWTRITPRLSGQGLPKSALMLSQAATVSVRDKYTCPCTLVILYFGIADDGDTATPLSRVCKHELSGVSQGHHLRSSMPDNSNA